MKRSRAVQLTLVASASTATLGAAAGCSAPRQEVMHCVERGTNRVVPDSLCGPATAGQRGSGDFGGAATAVGRPGVYGGYGGYAPYLWYYGGSVDRGWMRSGGYTPMRGSYYRSGSGYSVGRSGSLSSGSEGAAGRAAGSHGTVSHGGFGGTANAHASGG